MALRVEGVARSSSTSMHSPSRKTPPNPTNLIARVVLAEAAQRIAVVPSPAPPSADYHELLLRVGGRDGHGAASGQGFARGKRKQTDQPPPTNALHRVCAAS